MRGSPSLAMPAGASGAPAGAVGADAVPSYALRLGELWSTFQRQPAAFWLVCAYLMFEYVRPQTIYPVIDVLPWATLAIVCALATHLAAGKSLSLDDPASRLILVHTVVLFASAATAWRPSVSLEGWNYYIPWVLVYFLISNIVVTERRFLLFYLAFLLFSFKMAQHATLSWAANGFRFRAWGATGAPGWFHNSGEMGIQMCVFLPMATYFALAVRPYTKRLPFLFFASFPAFTLGAAIASSSRGALLGCAAVAVWMLSRTRHFVKGGLALAAMGLLVMFLLPAEQLQRFHGMGDDGTSTNRLTYWRDGIEIIKNHPLLGIGYNNWIPFYRTYYNAARGELPHNIFIEVASQLGLLGLLVFLAMIAATLVLNARSRRMAARLPDGRMLTAFARGLDGALVGYLVSGSFITVYFYPYFWLNLAMTTALYRTVHHELARVAALAPAGAPPVAMPMPFPPALALASGPPYDEGWSLAPPRRRPQGWRRPSQLRRLP
jgi:O-antigen ligase